MDITEALRRTENSLRDFIEQAFRTKHGDNWVNLCGINTAQIKKWEAAKLKEQKKQKYGVVEPRLIYYADFYDLYPILKSNWTHTFELIFGVDYNTMDVWLEALRTVRNQEAHGREILEHQKYMALGAAGEIRTRLIRYRSKMETAEDYFPRIERVNDDIGNVWTTGQEKVVKTYAVLRSGDLITFTITASDPHGATLEYCIVLPHFGALEWRKSYVLPVHLNNLDIARECKIEAYIRGTGDKYHANGLHWDDTVAFVYTVLPNP